MYVGDQNIAVPTMYYFKVKPFWQSRTPKNYQKSQGGIDSLAIHVGVSLFGR